MDIETINLNYHGACTTSLMSTEETTMDQFIKSLRARRAKVQASIDDEQARPVPDAIRLSALKKLRLRFKEQIETLERMNRQGKPVTIPVVRRSTVLERMI
jgi:hypothetical protein